jgi:hypothetical protein
MKSFQVNEMYWPKVLSVSYESEPFFDLILINDHYSNKESTVIFTKTDILNFINRDKVDQKLYLTAVFNEQMQEIVES